MKSILILVVVVVSCVYAHLTSPSSDEAKSQTRVERDLTYMQRIPNGFIRSKVGRDPLGFHGKVTVKDQIMNNPMGTLLAQAKLSGHVGSGNNSTSLATKLNFSNSMGKASVRMLSGLKNGNYKYRLGSDVDIGRNTDLSSGMSLDANKNRMDYRVRGRYTHRFS